MPAFDLGTMVTGALAAVAAAGNRQGTAAGRAIAQSAQAAQKQPYTVIPGASGFSNFLSSVGSVAQNPFVDGVLDTVGGAYGDPALGQQAAIAGKFASGFGGSGLFNASPYQLAQPQNSAQAASYAQAGPPPAQQVQQVAQQYLAQLLPQLQAQAQAYGRQYGQALAQQYAQALLARVRAYLSAQSRAPAAAAPPPTPPAPSSGWGAGGVSSNTGGGYGPAPQLGSGSPAVGPGGPPPPPSSAPVDLQTPPVTIRRSIPLILRRPTPGGRNLNLLGG